MKFIFLFIFFSTVILAQDVDSTYLKSLEQDYKDVSARLTESQKEQERLKGILLYIENSYRKEAQKLDSLKNR